MFAETQTPMRCTELVEVKINWLYHMTIKKQSNLHMKLARTFNLKLKYCATIVCFILLQSCIKDRPQEPSVTSVSINADNKVLVVNEGNYGWGIGTVSLYDPASGSAVEDYYKQQNANATLGNVCQSVTKYNNNYYIVMNNSNKIVVANASDFVKKATIPGFNSPRYLLPITYSKAYVSDLYQNSIQVVDLNANVISGSISCAAGTEEMALIYNKAFVTNSNTNYCYVINTMTDVITDSIAIGVGGSSIAIDKNSKVWVLTVGNATTSQAAKLVRINPINLQVELSLSFPVGDGPIKLTPNKTRDTLYYINKGVNRFLISQNQLPSNPLISQGSKKYYGLGVHPKTYQLYVSDAIDYVQKSKIEIYDVNGNIVSGFNAGVMSNSFVFE